MKKLALLLLLAGLPLLANANLLTNGSFESEDQAKRTWNIYNNLIDTGHDTLSLSPNGVGDGDVKLMTGVAKPESYILILTDFCLLGFVSRRLKAV